MRKKTDKNAADPSFLSLPYGGYYHRQVPTEDGELTHVGPGTPCGVYFRRFWQPIVFLEELKDLPVRVRVLGEDLIVFRDRRGEVGTLELYCSHRGASLEFGQISEKGIRCCYHGWLYDVDGKILETPGEPPSSTLKERLYHGAYPTYVYKGLVFVYMGPPDKKPAFPIYDTFHMRGYRQWIGVRHLMPCNWLQIKENCMDPAHLSFLHTIEGNVGFGQELGIKSELDYMVTPIGMIYIDSRRVVDKVWVRIADYICPNIHQFGAPRTRDFTKESFFLRPMMTHWSVPVDDAHTMNFRLRHVREDETDKVEVWGFGQVGDRPYEERQRVPGDYDIQISIRGGMAIHALEHLATTDHGVITLRNMLRQGIQAVRAGLDPKGIYWESGSIIPTYSNDTVLYVPPGGNPEVDRKIIRGTGRQIAECYIKNPPGIRSDPRKEAERVLRESMSNVAL